MQVENEYGSFGKDKVYLNAIRTMHLAAASMSPFPPRMDQPTMLAGGTLPDVASVMNFGRRPQKEFENFAKFRTGRAAMCGEYWVGWFDHWGEAHHTGDNKVHLAGIDWMLSRDIGFNLYMVHGGTSLRFHERRELRDGRQGYEPDVSSYDYDSPIDEAGRLAPKFALYRDVIGSTWLPGETLPDPPAPLPMITIPRFELRESASLLATARKAGRSRAAENFRRPAPGLRPHALPHAAA